MGMANEIGRGTGTSRKKPVRKRGNKNHVVI